MTEGGETERERIRRRITSGNSLYLGTIGIEQIHVYLCIIYGIVIIEIYSYNKELYTCQVTYSFFNSA